MNCDKLNASQGIVYLLLKMNFRGRGHTRIGFVLQNAHIPSGVDEGTHPKSRGYAYQCTCEGIADQNEHPSPFLQDARR
jgi:hypothetical protein